MTSAPPRLLPRLGVGAMLSLLLLGTFLLLPVTGQTAKGLTCKHPRGPMACPAKGEYCCFQDYRSELPMSGCMGAEGCKGKCVDVTDKYGGIQCTCAENLCNDVDNPPWKGDSVYEKYKSGSSSTPQPSRNNAALMSVLLPLVVVTALGSLPHLF